MKKTQHGLTEAGFVIKPLSVILEEEKQSFREAFGDDIDLSDESVAGAYVGNQAAKIAELWEQLEGLWDAGDVDSAGGVFLDRLAAFVNVDREAAKKTQVTACLWGDEGTTVPKGTLAKLATTEEMFSLARATEITRASLLGIVVAVTDTADLSITIGAAKVSVACVEDDTEDTLRDKLAAAIEERLGETLSVENADGVLQVLSTDGVTAFHAEVSGALEAVRLGSPAVFEAREAGRIYAPSGTLTVMVSNVQGVASVTNYATGTTGRDAESDTELRIGMRTRQKQAKCTDPAIENAVAKVQGVTFARVYSNRDMVYDGDRPPKSFETVVMGGDEQSIAEAIKDNMPAGIQPYGTTVRTVKDSEGSDWEIGFSRPVSRNIWIKVRLSLYDEESFPAGGAAAVRDNIVDWGGDNLGVSTDLIFQRLNIPVYAVPGIAHADILVAVTADPDTPPGDGEYAAQNIPVGEVEIAVIDAGRISVEVAS